MLHIERDALESMKSKGQREGDEYLGGACSSDFCLLVIDVTSDWCCTNVHRQNEAFLIETVPLTPHCWKVCPSVPQIRPTSSMISSYWSCLQPGWMVRPDYTLSAPSELQCGGCNATFAPSILLCPLPVQPVPVNTLAQFSPPQRKYIHNQLLVLRVKVPVSCSQSLFIYSWGWDEGGVNQLNS